MFIAAAYFARMASGESVVMVVVHHPPRNSLCSATSWTLVAEQSEFLGG